MNKIPLKIRIVQPYVFAKSELNKPLLHSDSGDVEPLLRCPLAKSLQDIELACHQIQICIAERNKFTSIGRSPAKGTERYVKWLMNNDIALDGENSERIWNPADDESDNTIRLYRAELDKLLRKFRFNDNYSVESMIHNYYMIRVNRFLRITLDKALAKAFKGSPIVDFRMYKAPIEVVGNALNIRPFMDITCIFKLKPCYFITAFGTVSDEQYFANRLLHCVCIAIGARQVALRSIESVIQNGISLFSYTLRF